MTTRTYIRDNRGRFARNPERETDMTRMIYVVNWTPEGVGGFDWRWSKDDAERQALVLAVNSASTVNMHEVELPDEVGDDPEGITAWLDSEGWSDGGDPRIAERLEYLRGEIRAERISQGEVIELQGLAKHIDPGDVELLEWAGVPEFPEEHDPMCTGCAHDCPWRRHHWGAPFCGVCDDHAEAVHAGYGAQPCDCSGRHEEDD